MAIDTISPVADSQLDPGDSFSFRIDDTYTSITVEVETAGGWEYAYDSSLSGAQAGYTVSVVDLGSRHEFTVTRTAGWNLSPFSIRVVENETGSEATTTTNYTLYSANDYPQTSDPYFLQSIGDSLLSHYDTPSTYSSQAAKILAVKATEDGIEFIVGAGIDTTAIHDNVAGEIVAITEKVTPVNGDWLIIEDSADSNNKKRIQVGNLPSASGATAWVSLTDTPGSITATYLVRGNAGGTALEFIDPATVGVTDHGALSGLGDDDHPQYQTKVMERIGASTYSTVQHLQDIFHSSGLSSGGVIADAGSGQITVTAGTGFIRATDDALDTLLYFDFPNLTATTITDQTTRYVGVEYNSGTPQVVVRTTDSWDNNTDFRLGTVSRDGSTLHISQAPHQVGDHAGIMIERGREVMPLVRDNRTGGLILGEDGANRYVTVTAGALWEGLSRYTISAFDTDPGGAADTMTRIYRDGVGGWTYETAQTTWNNTQYDDGSGTLATMTNNRYAAHYFYVAVDGDLYMQYGQAEYSSLAQVADDTVPAVPFWFKDHCKLVGRIIFQKSASAASSIESAFDTTLTGTPVSDHGALAGLGDDDHTQYVLGAGTRAQDAALFTERADHVNTPAAGYGELWVKNSATQTLIFTDDAAKDRWLTTTTSSSLGSSNRLVLWTNSTEQKGDANLRYNGGELQVDGTTAALQLEERTTGPTFAAGYGHLWVRDDTPNSLVFTDDAGAELTVCGQVSGFGGSNFSIPYQDGVATGRLKFTSNLIYSGSNLQLTSAQFYSPSAGYGLVLTEAAAGTWTPAATRGQVWLRNDTPNTLMFTDDAGTDLSISRAPLMKAIFDTSTVDADPGAVYQGGVRFNNATMTSATQVFIDNQDPDGMGHASLTAYLQSGNSVIFYKAKDPTQHIRVRVEKTENNAGTYHTLYAGGVVASTGWTTPDLGEELYFEFQGASIEGRYHTQFKQIGTTLPIGITGDYVTLWASTASPPRYNLYDHNTSTSTEIVQADGKSIQDAVYLAERAAHVNTPATGKSEIWLDNYSTLPRLRFTDEAGVDKYIPNSSTVSNTGILVWSGVTGELQNTSVFTRSTAGRVWTNVAGGSFQMTEGASSTAPSASSGAIWVRNDDPNSLMYADGDGSNIRMHPRVTYHEGGSFNASFSTSTWVGSPNGSIWDTTAKGLSFGTGTDPTAQPYEVGYVCPGDCRVSRIECWVRTNNSAAQGEIAVYRHRWTSGTATVSTAQIATMTVPSVASNTYTTDISADVDVDLLQGDRIQMYYRSSGTPAGGYTVYYTATVLMDILN